MRVNTSQPIRHRFFQRGFTLIELMIVMVVLAVLAMVAIPSYQDSVRKGRRSEAVASLVAIQQAQERWRANNVAYAASAALTLAPPNGLGLPATSSQGRYAIAVSAAASASYVATASAVAGQGQTNDKAGSQTCATLTVTVTNGNAVNTPAVCWSR